MEESKMVLRTEDLVKKYGKRTVVSHVSIDVKQGEIVGLLGPNGAGKTTSFYMTVGLITPNEGRIFLDDLEITKYPVYKRAQSLLLQSLLSIGKSLLKSIRLSLLKMLLTKRTGKAGNSLLRSSATKFSSLVTTSLLQIQKDLQRALSLVAVTQFLLNLTRSVRFQKHLRQSRWLTRQAILQFLHTAAVKQQIQQSLTLR